MKFNYEPLGNLIEISETKNKDLAVTNLVGVNINKEFMPSVANTEGTNLSNYKIVKKDQFVYNNMQVARDRTIRIVRYGEDFPSIISPAYKIFQVIDNTVLNAEFLMLYFLRPEFDRVCWFYTDSSIRGSLDWKKFCNLKVPVPPMDIQEKIVNIYNFINERIHLKTKINQNLDRLLEIIFDNWFIQYNSFKNNKFKNTNLRKISYNWNITEFGNIINKISSGKRPIIKVNNETNEFNIPIYGASSITGYTNDWLYDKPVLIIGRVGTLGSIQRSINKSFPSDNTLVISPKYYNYTYQILKKIDHNSYNVGSTQPLIRQKDLLKIKIILPPRDIIEEYEKISNRIMKCILKNKLEIEKLTKLRDILLPKLMSGEFDVSNIEI